MKTASYATETAKDNQHPYTIGRRELCDKEVLIEIDYCGVCHTDLHFVNNGWGMTE